MTTDGAAEFDTKMCATCHKVKPIDEFYSSKSGVRYDCKVCHRIYQQAQRVKNPEEDRRKSRERSKRRNYAGKKHNQLKDAARKFLTLAIKLGHIERKPCEVCGSSGEGHHPDYLKPLEVRWLCSVHHRQLHYGIISLAPEGNHGGSPAASALTAKDTARLIMETPGVMMDDDKIAALIQQFADQQTAGWKHQSQVNAQAADNWRNQCAALEAHIAKAEGKE